MDRQQQGVTQVIRADEAEDMRGRKSEENKITVPQGNVIHNQTGQEVLVRPSLIRDAISSKQMKQDSHQVPPLSVITMDLTEISPVSGTTEIVSPIACETQRYWGHVLQSERFSGIIEDKARPLGPIVSRKEPGASALQK